jgi:hypothetical protein
MAMANCIDRAEPSNDGANCTEMARILDPRNYPAAHAPADTCTCRSCGRRNTKPHRLVTGNVNMEAARRTSTANSTDHLDAAKGSRELPRRYPVPGPRRPESMSWSMLILAGHMEERCPAFRSMPHPSSGTGGASGQQVDRWRHRETPGPLCQSLVEGRQS